MFINSLQRTGTREMRIFYYYTTNTILTRWDPFTLFVRTGAINPPVLFGNAGSMNWVTDEDECQLNTVFPNAVRQKLLYTVLYQP